jgi:predicted nucleotidyltransferase
LKLNYSSDVIDIVQFGSSVIDEKVPRDIDVAVIFKNISLKKQLNEAQNIKRQLEKESEHEIHIKSYDFYSLFDKTNFAIEGIIFYGFSLITGKKFALLFGLNPKIRIKYDLLNLEKKDKVRFNYALSGKQKKYGLLKKFNGKLIAPQIIEIFPENEIIFVNALNKITNRIILEKIFVL